jgi:ABC-2 type transport system permease protein
LNYLYFLVSSLLPTMLQLFVIVAAVHAVGVELKEGTGPEWLASAGGSVTRAVVGKLLPYTVGFLLVAWFMVAFTLRFMGVPLHGDLTTVLVGTVFFILAYEGIGVVLAAWFSNLRFATSAAAFIATPAFAFVGLTFPTMAMPPVAQTWGALLPLTHYLRLLVEQVMRGAPPVASLPELGALAAFLVVTPLLATHRLKTVLTSDRYWGRM